MECKFKNPFRRRKAKRRTARYEPKGHSSTLSESATARGPQTAWPAPLRESETLSPRATEYQPRRSSQVSLHWRRSVGLLSAAPPDEDRGRSKRPRSFDPNAAMLDNRIVYPQPPEGDASSVNRRVTLGGQQALMTEPSSKRFSEDVADRNIAITNKPLLPEPQDADAASDTEPAGPDEAVPRPGFQSSAKASPCPGSDMHNAENEDEGRTLAAPDLARDFPSQRTMQAGVPEASRQHDNLRAPAGTDASDESSEDSWTSTVEHPSSPQPPHTVEGANTLPTLDGTINLDHNADATTQTRWAPAQTREVVKPEVYHIREEWTTREIHTHDVYHRILPLMDVEMSPQRHFWPAEGGGVVETTGEMHGRAGKKENREIGEMTSKNAPKDPPPAETRTFGSNRSGGRSYMIRQSHP